MLKRLFSVLCVLCLCATVHAQELKCKVTVLHDKINGAGVDQQVFIDMERTLNEFMNSRKWTSDEYAASEKIDCNFLINLTGNKIGGDPTTFTATLSIQATRPVYNASYTTNTINYMDKELVFKFSQFNALRFDDNQVSGTDPLSANLMAVMAYYTYMMLALDYDSFSPSGGTTYFKKAQNVVNNAPEGKGINGWKSMENQRNRYWIVDQWLSPRFQEMRNFWYTMHRESLDSMSQKPVEARTRILVNLKKIYNVNRENPNSIAVQFLFNAKSEEILKLLGQTPKQERTQYITLLAATDVTNAAKYNALR